MSFNFPDLGSILDRFENKSRFLVFLVLGAIVFAWAVAVPICKAWFESDAKQCTVYIQRNEELTNKIVEINHVYLQYVETSTSRRIAERMETLHRMNNTLMGTQQHSTQDRNWREPQSVIEPDGSSEYEMGSVSRMLKKNDSIQQEETQLMYELGRKINEAKKVNEPNDN